MCTVFRKQRTINKTKSTFHYTSPCLYNYPSESRASLKAGPKLTKMALRFWSCKLNHSLCQMMRGDLIVSALVPGATGPGSSPSRGRCVVFLGKTLYSHIASLHPGVQMGFGELLRGSDLRWTSTHPGVE